MLHVGLPTNFKAARFSEERSNELFLQLEADIVAVRIDEKDVPV